MKKQKSMGKLVRKILIVAVAVFLLGTLIPIVGSACDKGRQKYIGNEAYVEIGGMKA